MKIKYFALLPALCLVQAAQGAEISSPSGNIVVTTSVSADGTPLYAVTLDGKPVINSTPLGLVLDFADLSTGLKETGCDITKVDRSYVQDKIKKSHIDVKANEGVVKYEGEKKKLNIEWHVADDGVAYRYYVPSQSGKAAMVVKEEASSFSFPSGTSTFLTPQSDAMIGWKRTKPSYEEYYVVDAPMDSVSQYGHGYTFPALFKTPDGIWTLITETGVDGYYCGSHLSDFKDGKYTIAFPMEEENNGNGSATPGVKVPGYTPWRVMAIGNSLAPIVETTLPWDLVEPRYDYVTKGKARPAKGTWSWILWQDPSINYDDQVKFIDFAADMGYDNVLVDDWWDKNIGTERMEELIKYAKSKGVRLTLWYSSSGSWNDIVQGPVNRMDRPIVRKKWMKWMRDNGVDAVKVDFFGGDKQETIRLYEDILSDAADYGIDVVFHGCTLPRGWERMYPNFVGAEAVLASENLVFGQEFCDMEALHASLHPFIRNAAAIMEYGGSPLNKSLNRKNEGKPYRRTTDAFELATSVLFQNPVQYFALAPNNLTDAPAVAIDFLKNVPTTWDDTKYIDGYPGKYAVVARRHGNKWYIAGVSNLDQPTTLNLNLPMFEKGTTLEMINDDKTGQPILTELKVKDPQKVVVTINPNSGFVIHR
ncbi:MAG: glycoside hydrolase family 97 protein [Muribaculaceae bacterium]|nr:glycoside hydrolase family 97 protein [Muribaculaceae bacterium]